MDSNIRLNERTNFRMWVEHFELYIIVCGMEHNNFRRVCMASEETESLTESCSDTRSERGSEDRVSETESVSSASVDSQKPAKKFHSDVRGYFERNANGKESAVPIM